MPHGAAVSMFGFDCKDPFAGIAPGTRAGELARIFSAALPARTRSSPPIQLRSLGSFKRETIRAASSYVHPARWGAIYAPQLRILEEDILTRFSGHELDGAVRCAHGSPHFPIYDETRAVVEQATSARRRATRERATGFCGIPSGTICAGSSRRRTCSRRKRRKTN